MMRKYFTTVIALAFCCVSSIYAALPVEKFTIVYKLHGQTRRYSVNLSENADTLKLNWGIERNTKWQSGSYAMPSTSRKSATQLSFAQPIDGSHLTLDNATFALISSNALAELKSKHSFNYGGVSYKLKEKQGSRICVVDTVEGREMTILDDANLPLILRMANNPLGINWAIDLADDDIAGKLPYGASGGVYYAYPVTQTSLQQPPAGFYPVLISHYGRHGSRQAIKVYPYTDVIDEFARQHDIDNLTPLGVEVEAKVNKLWNDAKGKLGSLTKLGERQHKAIASRMIENFPSLFLDSAHIEVYASTEPRCIVSMAAFCERLKEIHPSLDIDRHVTPGGMDIISYSSPEAVMLNKDDAPWRDAYIHWSDSLVNQDHLMHSLFKSPEKVQSASQFVRFLHDLAVTEQNLDTSMDLLNIFTDDELYALWRVLNYNMYVKHAYSGISNAAGPNSAKSLLNHVIATADSVLAFQKPGVILRFGHDTALIRLLALMQVDGCANAESNPDLFHEVWQDYKISPMAANLQLLFYRNDSGKVIVQLLHNEAPATLPIEQYSPGFYDWQTLRQFWLNKLPQ